MLSVVVSEIQGDYIEILDLSDINHVKNVFRKNIGDKLRAVDGKNEYFCKIEEIDEKHIKLKIIEKKEDKFSLNIKIDAGISILKGDKMDLTIQKLTELGINKIIPILANRCVVKLDKKKDRWDNISKEALKQCQGVNPTIIDDIKKMNELEFEKYDLIIVPYESEKNIYIKEILKNKDKEIKNILYIIGPEGGFENEEIELLKKREAKIISLGNRILRAETAAIVTGGVIINEFF
ncbi:RsmE family RNA methyltransferase [Fusobacterium massiliense]|uniref:RsmE family RNA methyltransferase n=1 Tax=Fusobacterium massiliense TaxID=1852365 RepID=UPI000939EF27|nr:16S rRNA (uracil(1498)-N(3))-methyltransferase [Fusobacterium massiliense]